MAPRGNRSRRGNNSNRNINNNPPSTVPADQRTEPSNFNDFMRRATQHLRLVAPELERDEQDAARIRTFHFLLDQIPAGLDAQSRGLYEEAIRYVVGQHWRNRDYLFSLYANTQRFMGWLEGHALSDVQRHMAWHSQNRVTNAAMSVSEVANLITFVQSQQQILLGALYDGYGLSSQVVRQASSIWLPRFPEAPHRTYDPAGAAGVLEHAVRNVSGTFMPQPGPDRIIRRNFQRPEPRNASENQARPPFPEDLVMSQRQPAQDNAGRQPSRGEAVRTQRGQAQNHEVVSGIRSPPYRGRSLRELTPFYSPSPSPERNPEQQEHQRRSQTHSPEQGSSIGYSTHTPHTATPLENDQREAEEEARVISRTASSSPAQGSQYDRQWSIEPPNPPPPTTPSTESSDTESEDSPTPRKYPVALLRPMKSKVLPPLLDDSEDEGNQPTREEEQRGEDVQAAEGEEEESAESDVVMMDEDYMSGSNWSEDHFGEASDHDLDEPNSSGIN